eukprot:6773348-Lingulodinium_polyedra.AAC.1
MRSAISWLGLPTFKHTTNDKRRAFNLRVYLKSGSNNRATPPKNKTCRYSPHLVPRTHGCVHATSTQNVHRDAHRLEAEQNPAATPLPGTLASWQDGAN